MEPQKSIILPVALSVLVSAVIFGGLGYYLADSKNTTETSVTPTYSSQTTVTTKPIVTPTTAALKTYENKTFNFTMKYPSDWKVDDTNTTNGGAEGVIAFYKGTSLAGSPSLTININEEGRGVQTAEINYDIEYKNDEMKITNRSITTSSETGEIVKGKVHFRNAGGSNIDLRGKIYYIVGLNLSNRANEDEAIDILSSFKFTK